MVSMTLVGKCDAHFLQMVKEYSSLGVLEIDVVRVNYN